jgi:hypothetical protein
MYLLFFEENFATFVKLKNWEKNYSRLFKSCTYVPCTAKNFAIGPIKHPTYFIGVFSTIVNWIQINFYRDVKP